MKLPVIPKKLFDLKSKYVPKGKITLSPFTVGQQDILLQVKESEDEQEKIEAIRQIIDECIQTPGVTAGELPNFVVEEAFVRLRQHAVGELVDLAYRCTHKVDEKSCDNTIPVTVDLRDFKLKEEEGHTNTIVLADPIGVKFKYPTMDTYLEQGNDDTSVILGCIDVIFDDANVYNSSDYSKDELIEFWNQLELAQKKEIYDKFFLTMPHMHYKKTIKCSKCGFEHTVEFNSSFEVFR